MKFELPPRLVGIIDQYAAELRGLGSAQVTPRDIAELIADVMGSLADAADAEAVRHPAVRMTLPEVAGLIRANGDAFRMLAEQLPGEPT